MGNGILEYFKHFYTGIFKLKPKQKQNKIKIYTHSYKLIVKRLIQQCHQRPKEKGVKGREEELLINERLAEIFFKYRQDDSDDDEDSGDAMFEDENPKLS